MGERNDALHVVDDLFTVADEEEGDHGGDHHVEDEAGALLYEIGGERAEELCRPLGEVLQYGFHRLGVFQERGQIVRGPYWQPGGEVEVLTAVGLLLDIREEL